jgi:hypothetical protein
VCAAPADERERRGRERAVDVLGSGTQPAFRLLLATALVFITWQALSPAPVVDAHGTDKLLHAAAFVVLAWLADFGWPSPRYWLPKALPLLGYGAFIELAQLGTATRSAEWGDLAADALGLALYPLLVALLRRLPTLAERRGG